MTEAANAEIQTTTVETPETSAATVETPSIEDLQAQLVAAQADNATLTSDRDKWKGLSRKHEAASKAPATDADRLAALEQRAEAAERKALTTSIAATKGVPVEVLHGNDEDELTASADRFLAAVAVAAQAQAPAAPPANDANASGARGAAVGGSVKQLTRADLQGMSPAEIVAAKEAGQLRDLASGK